VAPTHSLSPQLMPVIRQQTPGRRRPLPGAGAGNVGRRFIVRARLQALTRRSPATAAQHHGWLRLLVGELVVDSLADLQCNRQHGRCTGCAPCAVRRSAIFGCSEQRLDRATCRHPPHSSATTLLLPPLPLPPLLVALLSSPISSLSLLGFISS